MNLTNITIINNKSFLVKEVAVISPARRSARVCIYALLPVVSKGLSEELSWPVIVVTTENSFQAFQHVTNSQAINHFFVYQFLSILTSPP